MWRRVFVDPDFDSQAVRLVHEEDHPVGDGGCLSRKFGSPNGITELFQRITFDFEDNCIQFYAVPSIYAPKEWGVPDGPSNIDGRSPPQATALRRICGVRPVCELLGQVEVSTIK